MTNLSGVWLNAGNSSQPCRIQQFGDKVFFTDEGGSVGVARIQGQTLQVGQYVYENLKATINADGTRIEWPNNFWSLDHRDNHVKIYIETLRCDKETDGFMAGTDEIFFTVSGARSNGDKFLNCRFPVPSRDMHEDGTPEHRNVWNLCIWEGSIEPNEFVSGVLLVWEDDNAPEEIPCEVFAMELSEQQVISAINLSPKALANIKSRPAIIGFSGSNDVVGHVAFTVRRESDGSLSSHWEPIFNAEKTSEVGNLFGQDRSVGKFDLTGAGSDYKLWVSPWDGSYST